MPIPPPPARRIDPSSRGGKALERLGCRPKRAAVVNGGRLACTCPHREQDPAPLPGVAWTPAWVWTSYRGNLAALVRRHVVLLHGRGVFPVAGAPVRRLACLGVAIRKSAKGF